MDAILPNDLKKLKDFNFIKYKGVPPSFSLVRETIEKSNLKRKYKFERVWGIPKGSIRLYLKGHRDLPSMYWHIFYDFDAVNQKYRKKTRVTKKSTRLRTKGNIQTPNKAYIDEFKNRQSAG